MKITIEIDNITEAQAIAIEDMMAQWEYLGKLGSSRWTAFFADGDGNFRPNIKVDGEIAERTTLMNTKFPANYNDDKNIWRNLQVEITKNGDGQPLETTKWRNVPGETYMMDFDSIAWKLHKD